MSDIFGSWLSPVRLPVQPPAPRPLQSLGEQSPMLIIIAIIIIIIIAIIIIIIIIMIQVWQIQSAMRIELLLRFFALLPRPSRVLLIIISLHELTHRQAC